MEIFTVVCIGIYFAINKYKYCIYLIRNEVMKILCYIYMYRMAGIYYTPAPKERGYTVLPMCVPSRLSVCPSVTNFRHSFLSNYSSSMLEILTHSSLGHAIWWDSFLCESDANFLFIRASVRRVYMKFSSQFSQQLLIADA